MTFPESDRVIFDKNPLEQVICQLRFPTILEITTEQPARFQNAIRGDYPLYEIDQAVGNLPKEFAELMAQLPISQPVASPTHKFTSADGDRVVSLSGNSVAFADKRYERWETFSAEVFRAQRALEDIYQPAFYARIGLRYTNVVDRARIGIGDEPWDSLLGPSLLGLLGAPDVAGKDIEAIKSEATVLIDEVPGAKATIRHGTAERTPDKAKVYVIDVDFYTVERSTNEHVAQILAEFNRHNGNFFRWAITDKLHAALEPRAAC